MKINKLIDYTYLKAYGTKVEIDKLLINAKKWNLKSVCVHPIFVKYCIEKLKESEILVGTVIGFPLGTNTMETKVFETLNAISNGADEIDMVINIGELKQGNYDFIEAEINQVCKAAMGHSVKVIIEAGYLSEKEIIMVSKIINKTKAKFISISTGLYSDETLLNTIDLLKNSKNDIEVKATISNVSKANLQDLIKAGVTRIGTENCKDLFSTDNGNELG